MGANHPGVADCGCLSTALHGLTSKALVHVCARTGALLEHACTSVQTGARQLRARSHLHVPRSLSWLRTEMPVRAHGGEPRPLASRLPPAASCRGVWLISAPAAATGRRGQRQVPAFHLLRLSAPASPHIIPVSNRERPFPSGPTGDGATQGHPSAQEGSWQAARRRRRVMRKETLGFPVPLGSPGLFGVLD